MLYAQAAFEAGAAIYNNINNNIEIEMKSKLEEYGQNKHRLNSKAFDVVDVGRDGRLQASTVQSLNASDHVSTTSGGRRLMSWR